MGIQIPTEHIKTVEKMFFNYGTIVLNEKREFQQSLVHGVNNLFALTIINTLKFIEYAEKIHSCGHLYFWITEKGIEGLKKKI